MAEPIQPPDGSFQILIGHPADPEDWPATRVFAAAGWGCTATAVGPMTILTAAHCLKDGTTGQFQAKNVWISISCTKYPGWEDSWPNPITSYDIALCRTDETIPRNIAAGERYERIDTSPTALPLNMIVTLLGYGCTATDPSLKVFAQGYSTTDSNDFGAYVRTKAGGQNAQFCPGDSGGGVYREEPGSRRQIVGIASRGDKNNSWITKLFDPHVKTFIDEWAASNQICGINASDGSCHD